jgi:hypothetical protein
MIKYAICLALLSTSTTTAFAFVHGPAASTSRKAGGRMMRAAAPSSSRMAALPACVPDVEFLRAANDAVVATTSLTSSTSSSTSALLSVATLDPTSVLSDALGGLLGSYAILAVPVIAGLSVVALIAFLIVSYANPADEDD